MSKYLTTIFFACLFVMIGHFKVNAESTGICIISQLDKTYEVETPFYWYKVSENNEVSDSLTQNITYTHTTTYIDTSTKCNAINGSLPSYTKTTNALSSLTVTYHYSEKQITNSETLFNASASIFEMPSIINTKDLTIRSDYISLDEMPPIIATNDLNSVIAVSVDTILNVDFLLNKISAHDEVDGLVAVKIHEDNYSNNKKILGEYPLTFSATDKSENTAYLTITIKVIDTTSPIIYGQNYLKSYISNPLKLDDIKNTLTIKDNYYSLNSSNLKIIEDTYSNSLQKEGIFTLSFNITDPSNNTSKIHTIKIENYDDIAPTISGDNHYEVSNKILLNLENIKSNLIINDNIDINPTIELTSDNYTPNYHKIGLYQIVYTAIDKNGNKSSPHTINITIKDITKPTFYISKKFIGIDGSANITIEQLIDIIQESNNISEKDLINYTIITDEYSSNKDVPGTYLIELNYDYENKESINIQTYVVVENYSAITNKINVTKEKSIWEIIKDFIVKLWNIIKNIFNLKLLKK